MQSYFCKHRCGQHYLVLVSLIADVEGLVKTLGTLQVNDYKECYLLYIAVVLVDSIYSPNILTVMKRAAERYPVATEFLITNLHDF